MGRKAGVSAEQTRQELLEAAARVFAREGYDGASIADITAEAGLSSGVIYSNYGSKAELFVATVRESAHRDFFSLAGLEQISDISNYPDATKLLTSTIIRVGSEYGRGHLGQGSLLLEAIVASKRHAGIAELITSWMAQGQELLGALVQQAQDEGVVDSELSSAAISRLLIVNALGELLASALDLPRVDDAEWARLLERFVQLIEAD